MYKKRAVAQRQPFMIKIAFHDFFESHGKPVCSELNAIEYRPGRHRSENSLCPDPQDCALFVLAVALCVIPWHHGSPMKWTIGIFAREIGHQIQSMSNPLLFGNGIPPVR
jgi:hypothetical protein